MGRHQIPDTTLHTFNILRALPIPVAERVWLLAELHRAAGCTVPPDRMLAGVLSLESVRSLKDLSTVRGFGRRRRANLRRALSRRRLPGWLETLLTELTQNAVDAPPVHFPHPLGAHADFPPRIAQRLLLEATQVLGEPVPLPGFPFSHPKIHHFREAIQLPTPRSAVIIGGGYVGVELAMAWAARGCVVSVIDTRRQILAGFIPTIVDEIEADVRAAGIHLLAEAEAVGWAERGDRVVVFAETWDGTVALWGACVVVAVGVREASLPE